VRRLGLLTVLAAAAVLLSGCGSSHRQTATTSPSTSTTTPTPRPAPHREAVRVTVVDGDTNRRVAGARVAVGGRSATTNRHGVARFELRRRGDYVTTARAAGYTARAVRLPFQLRRGQTLRLYQAALQWPVYGATAARTHAQTALRVRPPFRVVWSRGLGSLVEFPAVVSDGVAYVGNAHETIRALSMRDGKVAWRRDVPGGKLASSPAVYRDLVIVHGMDGAVRALRRTNGSVVWQVHVGSPIESSPSIAGGLDVFGDWRGDVVALDLDTHRVRWRRSDGCKITSSASIVGHTAYLGDYCGRLLALDVRTGRLRWSRSVDGRVYGTPAVAHGRVFVPSSTGGSLTAFTTSGRYLWRRHFGSYVYSSPAVWDGRVFVGDYGGGFYALSAATGATRWEVGAGGSVSGAAVVVDGVAYAGSFGHEIVGVDARSGRVLVRFPHGEYVPVSGSGQRLLLHGYSRVWAVVHR
jgi:outer membrane protein assembly factor BamB